MYPPSKPVVLIAEDNPGLARVLSLKFKTSGFAPLVCSDGLQAWETFQQHDVAAVISDQEMPRMSGIELCRKIHQSDPGMPLFLITGHQLELSSQGIEDELGITRIFGKPFSPASVVSTVNDAIENNLAGRLSEV